MYAVRPFFDHSFQIKLPDCMYPLNSLTAIDKVQVPVLKMVHFLLKFMLTLNEQFEKNLKIK